MLEPDVAVLKLQFPRPHCQLLCPPYQTILLVYHSKPVTHQLSFITVPTSLYIILECVSNKENVAQEYFEGILYSIGYTTVSPPYLKIQLFTLFYCALYLPTRNYSIISA